MTEEKQKLNNSLEKLRERKEAGEEIPEEEQIKKGLQRSESVIFMQDMVRNASLSALIELYDIDEMFQ